MSKVIKIQSLKNGSSVIKIKTVANEIPDSPIAGINKKPNINNGFRTKLAKKPNIKVFLYVFVSPKATKIEFREKLNIKNIVPNKIGFI